MKMFSSHWKRPATGEARRERRRRPSFYQRLLGWVGWRQRAHPGATGVSPASKRAMSRASRPGASRHWSALPTWKSAIRQVWKPALRAGVDRSMAGRITIEKWEMVGPEVARRIERPLWRRVEAALRRAHGAGLAESQTMLPASQVLPRVRGGTGIELSKGATPILPLLTLMSLLPQSNLESKSKSMSKSKRQGIPPNSMAVVRSGGSGLRCGRRQFPLGIGNAKCTMPNVQCPMKRQLFTRKDGPRHGQ